MPYTNGLFTCQDWNFPSYSNGREELPEALESIYGRNQLCSEASLSFNSSSPFDHNSQAEMNSSFTTDNCHLFEMLNDADNVYCEHNFEHFQFPQHSPLQPLLRGLHLANPFNLNYFQNSSGSITQFSEVSFLDSPLRVRQENRTPSQAGKFLIFRQGGKLQLENVPSIVGPEKCTRIDLSVSKLCPFESITSTCWTEFEEHDRRRIVRVSKLHNGPSMELEFLIILMRAAQKNHPKDEANFIEISCLKFTDIETDNVEFLITALEVVRIVELLVWCDGKKRKLDKDEKGRIRSNLIPLWHRGFMNLGKNLTSSRKEFLEHLIRYEVRKPFKITKLMRLLSWENLIFALRKAIDFYRIVLLE